MNLPSAAVVRRVGIALGALALIALAAALWLPPFGILVRDDVEAWMAEELRAQAAVHLNPTLEFEAIHYAFPLTATVDGARLVADDGSAIIEAEHLELSLAQIPSRDQPLVMEGIEAHGVTVRLLGYEGGLRGFSGFVRRSEDELEDGDEAPRSALSDVFQLRDVRLTDARVEYRPSASAKTTVLDDLDLRLSFDEVPRPGTAIWYPVHLETHRGDVLDFALQGRLSLDDIAVMVESASLEITVDDATAQALPPGLLEIANAHRARGHLQMQAQGYWALAAPQRTLLHGSIRLRDFNASVGRWSFPVARAHADVLVLPGLVSLPNLEAEVMGGTVHAGLDIATAADDRRLAARLEARDLDLGQVLRARPGQASELEGTLSVDTELSVGLLRPEETLDGRASLAVRNGVLLVLPGLAEIANDAGHDLARRHEGDVTVHFDGRGMDVHRLHIETPALGVRGSGRIAWSGAMDMKMAIGPLQKADGGPVREALAKMGERLWQYRVRGTVSRPKIAPRPLGIGN